MKKPNRNDIRESAVVEIINSNGISEGNAVLIKHEPSYRPDRIPYIKGESSNPVQLPTCYIWTSERWKVLFIDGPNKGFTTHRYVHFFLFIRTQYPSGYFRGEFGAEPFSDEEKEIFDSIHERLYDEEE